MKFRHWLEYLGLRILGLWACLLPLPYALTLGSLLGQFVFSLIGFRRKVTLANLKRVFPEASEKEWLRIGARTYQNFARGMVEYLRFPKFKRTDIERLVEIEGLENFAKGFKRGKGIIAVTGHFGSWEILAAAVALKGYPVNVIYKEQHNRKVDELMNKYRRKMGIKVIALGVSLRQVLKALHQNEIVAFLSDQDAHESGVFVNFFGNLTSTPPGPILFALKTKAVLIPVFIVREEKFRHRIKILKPVEVQPSKDEKQDLIYYTTEYTGLLETEIRKNPDQYLWLHRRFKTKPPFF
ncbi:MAG: lysophospholipid acyltransferase family protein [Candidatus Edwardsbacteria bacterium]